MGVEEKNQVNFQTIYSINSASIVSGGLLQTSFSIPSINTIFRISSGLAKWENSINQTSLLLSERVRADFEPIKNLKFSGSFSLQRVYDSNDTLIKTGYIEASYKFPINIRFATSYLFSNEGRDFTTRNGGQIGSLGLAYTKSQFAYYAIISGAFLPPAPHRQTEVNLSFHKFETGVSFYHIGIGGRLNFTYSPYDLSFKLENTLKNFSVYFALNYALFPMYNDPYQISIGLVIPQKKIRLRHSYNVPEPEMRYESNGLTSTSFRTALRVASLLSKRGEISLEEAIRIQNSISKIFRERFVNAEAFINLALNDKSLQKEMEPSGISNEISLDIADHLRRGDWDGLVSKYSSANIEKKLAIAMVLGGIGNIYYDSKTANDSSRLVQYANFTPKEVFVKISQGLRSGERIPSGVCANINGMVTEFLRESGLEAYSVVVPNIGESHLVSIVVDRESKKVHLINYSLHTISSGYGVWNIIRNYSSIRGILPYMVQIFGVGLYSDSAERQNFQNAIGGEEAIKETLIE